MASADRNSTPGPTFPVAWIGGVVAGLVVALVAALSVGAELAIPVLVLTVLLAAVAIGYRTIGTSRTAAADSRDSVPRLNAEGDRPLGDTPQAHDEINPHDLPPDHPGRHAAEEMAEGEEEGEGTTAGMESGGAAGDDGPEEGSGEREPVEESRHGATTD